ncbi:MAG: hypothetical protein V1706_01095 [Pseudomonadota bacterium]
MDPAVLIPTADTIPAHWSLFQLLLTSTTTLHLLAMNVMLGISVIIFVSTVRANTVPAPEIKFIAGKLPPAIAITINFGVAPLLFLQVLYGQFIYTSSVLMAVYWLAVIPMLIAAYYLAYIFKYRQATMQLGRMAISGAVTLLFLIIAFIFTNNLTLMQRPDAWSDYATTKDGLMLNLGDPTLFPRYLHFVFSSLAIGGLAGALYHDYRKRRGAIDREEMIRKGVKWFIVCTVINTGFGFLFLGSLPKGLFHFSTLRDFFFVLFLIGGIGTALSAMVLAAARRVRPAALSIAASVFFMVIDRELLRAAYLNPYFNPTDLTLAPQYSPLFLFLLIFAGGVALIIYMLKLVARAEEVTE